MREMKRRVKSHFIVQFLSQNNRHANDGSNQGSCFSECREMISDARKTVFGKPRHGTLKSKSDRIVNIIKHAIQIFASYKQYLCCQMENNRIKRQQRDRVD